LGKVASGAAIKNRWVTDPPLSFAVVMPSAMVYFYPVIINNFINKSIFFIDFATPFASQIVFKRFGMTDAGITVAYDIGN
jgi:hypothetical protein